MELTENDRQSLNEVPHPALPPGSNLYLSLIHI